MKKLKKYLVSNIKLPIKYKVISWYDTFRLNELSFRMNTCNYEIVIDSYDAFEKEVGEGTACRVFESMMEECYSEPREYGQPLDREGGNWLFESHRYYCNDHLLLEFEVQDGNWSGTDIRMFEVTYE